MKRQKGSLMQRMMAVLLSAVLVVGMMWEAAPISVLAQESVSENTPEPVEGEIEPAEGEKEPAEETGSGEQEDPEKTEDEEKDPEGQEPGEGAEQEKPQPEDEKEKTPEPGKEDEKEQESVSENDAPAESVSENDAPTESVSENDAVDENSDLQALLERIDALPDAEEYLTTEPDADSGEADEAAYEEWLAGLYAYTEEALDIQEAIERLSEEEQAKIPEEALAKLAAWVEIAQTAGASVQVMAEEIESGSCGDNLTWTLENGVLTISGSGAMTDYEWRTKLGSSSPFSKLAKQNKNITTVKFIADATGAATSIGNYAFWGCSKLTSIEIPKGVTSIGDDAFDHCTSLTKITIPESVESIAVNAFSNCSNLETVTMQRKTPPTIGNSVFGSRNVGGSGCKFITDTDKAKGIHVPKGTADAYKEKWSDYADNIVDDVETDDNIASGAGWTLAQDGRLTITSNDGMKDWISWISKQDPPETYRAQVKSVEIKDGVTSIGASAFSGCSGLKKITIPDGVTNIGNSAFNGCSGLAEISIPNSVTSMGSAIFQDCSGLSKITITENVTSIGSYAFIRCSSLTSIKIPENVTNIGMYAFSGCSGLTEVTIPKKVESIGQFGFQGCSKLTKVTMESETPPELDVVAFTGCPCVEDTTKGIYVPVGALEAYQGTVGKEKGWEPYKDHITDGTTSSEKHEHDGVTFTAWTKTDSLPTDAGNYYLTENVTLTSIWWAPNGTTNLCLNGKTVSGSDIQVIEIYGSRTLKLYDCQNAGKITGGRNKAVEISDNGTFHMYGGNISDSDWSGSSNAGSSAVYVTNSTFHMYGGNISGNIGQGSGGVCIINNGTFKMYGGKISGNTAVFYGGGVCVDTDSNFYMNGGEITNNTVTRYEGGGVYSEGNITIGGEAKLTGNKKAGAEDNVYLETGKTIAIDTGTPLTGSAEIGVTTKTAPTDGHPVDITGHNKEDYSQYFTSDNPAYKIVNNDQVVQLTAPHTHSLARVDAKAATCTKDGNSAYYTCNGCDKWFSDAEGKQEITDKNSVKISKTGHSYDETAWGYKEEDGHAHVCLNCDAHDEVQAHTPGAPATEATPQTCTVCGYIIAPVIGHTCSPQPVAKKEPTCTAAGKQAYYHCEGCGKNYEDAEGKNLIADISTWGTIAALGHDWGEWKVTKKATATKTGEKERTCKRCDEKETETIPATGGGSGGGNQGGTSDGGSGGNNGGAGGGSDSGSSGGSNSGGTSPMNPKPGAPGTGQPKVKQEKKGNIQKEVRVEGGAAPDVEVATTLSDLADIVLTETEKQQAEAGTNIRIVLDVKDASDVISAADKTIVEMALNGAIAKGYTLGQYLDISLYKVVGNSRSDITQTSRKITVTIRVPDSLRNTDSETTRTFAVIRVHDGKAELLTDLDNEEDTVTIETDRFSTYAIVWQDTETADGGVVRVRVENGGNKKSGGKDSEPKTGDATPIELAATLSMIAGFTYLLLYFADRRHGMTEETKKELVSRLIGWGKRGGRIRRYLALAAIFVLLVYYHSIGKKTCVEWKEIYGE